MLLVSESAFKARPEAVKKLAEKRDVVVVRDCDYELALELLLVARERHKG